LATIVGRSIESVSWLASDIAPIGHFNEANLIFEAVHAEIWVLVTLSTRLLHCPTTALLQRSLQFAGKTFLQFAVDVPRDNLTKFVTNSSESRASAGEFVLIGLRDFRVRRLPGGVFRDDLLAAISMNAGPIGSASG
jgi:hypothetical protein